MSLLKTELEWHDLRVDPDDLPGVGEPIIVTLDDPLDGSRRVWLDVTLDGEEDGKTLFCTNAVNEYGRIEKTAVWYPVVAWAYPPEPYDYF